LRLPIGRRNLFRQHRMVAKDTVAPSAWAAGEKL
jgi:hypothetical protein